MMQPQRLLSLANHGFIRTVCLGLVAVLSLWGIIVLVSAPSATQVVKQERQIAQYYTLSAQALYAAETGIEEARARLRTYAGLYRIMDDTPDDPKWSVAIVAKGDGQEPGEVLPHHVQVASLQSDLAYTVTIRHATHPTDAAVLRWGDARGQGVHTRNTLRGENIYVITAHGMQGEARHTIEVEAIPEPPPTVPAALYVAGPLRLPGGRASITGTDSCGDQHQAGVRTTLPPSPMASKAGLTPPMLQGTPPVAYQSAPLHVQAMVDALKERATVVYTSVPAETASAGPGESWGMPRMGATPHAPSTCVERHIVHYDTRGTQGRLRPGTSGCGVLLVEGDVEIDGAFTWYGAVLVTGSLRLLGEGTKQVTGGVVVAGAVTLEDKGEMSLVYCSEAIAEPTRYLPLRLLTWRDDRPSMP